MAQQYPQRPPLTLRADKRYRATLQMEKGGEIVLDLFAEAAPETVNSFIFLAREGFYDGVTFHRVIPGFMAQGGDPTGTGTGGPGYTLPDEVNAHRHERGVIAMARTSAPHSAGSQFYLTLAPTPHLDGGYTVFGRVQEGLDVLDAIRPRDPRPGAPAGDAIRTITIEEQDAAV